MVYCVNSWVYVANILSWLGMWYKRSESQKRYSLFFTSTSLAGAFGGLLASAIGKSKCVL